MIIFNGVRLLFLWLQ